MKTKSQFILTLFTWVMMIVGSLSFVHFYLNGNVWATVGIIVLILLSVTVLSDLATIWLFILSTVAGVMIVIYGINYLTTVETVFYILLVPLLGILTIALNRLYYQVRTGNEIAFAQNRFHKHQYKIERIIMVSWAHFKQFKEVNPKETGRTLAEIKERLVQIPKEQKVYTLSDGCFLLFAKKGSALSREDVGEALSGMLFNNAGYGSQQAIQFQIAEESLNQDVHREETFQEVLKSLGRKLETEIIIEY